jgi:plastocyanin
VNPSNAINRLESVSFSTPGWYLVICNVAPHFADGMWAWIVVTGGEGHDH